MIKAFVGSIFDYIESEKIDCIQNAANCIGPMGRGIAGAIREHGGVEIQTDAFRACKQQNPEPGSCYVTIAGKLRDKGIKCIIHATTMKQPGGFTSLEIVQKAFESALQKAIELGIKNYGCTALGTGGYSVKLDVDEVAKIMVNVAKTYENDLNIIFADLNEQFIRKVKEHANIQEK
jgi:O-acetyl-ADP-ribose deacetylase